MKPEAPPPVSPAAEAEWVEGELVRNLMRTQRNTQWVGVFLIPIFVSVLWADAGHGLLLAWAFCASVVAATRVSVVQRYTREVVQRGVGEHVAFFRRYRMIWPVSALFWGLTTLLYF